ncbi:hypothetical protein Gotur_025082 [Gossypium turneri]
MVSLASKRLIGLTSRRSRHNPFIGIGLVGASACGDPWLVEEKLWSEYGGDQAVDGEDLRAKVEPFGNDDWPEKAMNDSD